MVAFWILAVLNFLLCTVLPMYLAHIRATHWQFWFNVLPVGAGAFWATLLQFKYLPTQKDSGIGLLFFLVCMLLIIFLNVVLMALSYRLIFKKSIMP
jgi:hypothetical protein